MKVLLTLIVFLAIATPAHAATTTVRSGDAHVERIALNETLNVLVDQMRINGRRVRTFDARGCRAFFYSGRHVLFISDCRGRAVFRSVTRNTRARIAWRLIVR